LKRLQLLLYLLRVMPLPPPPLHLLRVMPLLRVMIKRIRRASKG
jgi:hypothetical protein